MNVLLYRISTTTRDLARNSFSRRRRGHLWGRLYFKIRGFKIEKKSEGRGGGWKQRRECCGCSTAVVNRCYCSSSYYYYTSSWRDDFTFFYALHCNRNREGNLRRGIRKYEREREKRMWREQVGGTRGSLYFALMAP